MRRLVIYLFLICLLFLSGNNVIAKNNKASFEGQGYVGTLPDLSRHGENQSKEVQSSPDVRPSKDFNSENEIKPTPKDNPAFVNIILKKDTTTQYAKDLNEFINILEDINELIEQKSNVQIFNAKVYYFNKNADYFREKYLEKPEAQFESYRKLLELSLHSKSIAVLRAEAQKYNPYLAYESEGYIYSPTNIQEQLNYLHNEIEQTIVLLKESN